MNLEQFLRELRDKDVEYKFLSEVNGPAAGMATYWYIVEGKVIILQEYQDRITPYTEFVEGNCNRFVDYLAKIKHVNNLNKGKADELRASKSID